MITEIGEKPRVYSRPRKRAEGKFEKMRRETSNDDLEEINDKGLFNFGRLSLEDTVLLASQEEDSLAMKLQKNPYNGPPLHLEKLLAHDVRQYTFDFMRKPLRTHE